VALLLVALSLGDKSCGPRSASGAARTRRGCSCRCRWGASRAVVNRTLVPRARGVSVRAVVGGGQVVRSSRGRWCGAHGAVVNRPLVRRAWCGRRSAGGAARTRRCCSWHCRRGASRAVVGRPLVPRARGVAVRAVVGGGQVVRSSIGRWCGAHGAVVGRPLVPRARGVAVRAAVVWGHVVRSSVGRWCGAQGAGVGRPEVRRARGAAARGIVVGGQDLRLSVGRWCRAHAALLFVPLSLGGTSCGRQ